VTGQPTVVLVHGAFADASSWNGVIERLQAKGMKVTAPANPLRGISHDSACLAGVFEETPGPVLAVGHSYGGAGISHAATKAKNAVGLVYVAAFGTEEGESLGEPSGVPAWKSVPAWAVVATGDKAAGADVIRSMAKRAGAAITEVEGSHVIMISQPQVVTDVILSAVTAVAQVAAVASK
jgi:pimeloyl-ACP methyl ester carboxylesterase